MSRNLTKPFTIAGFVLAELYMLFTTLAPYGRETVALPMPIPETAEIAPGTPPPLSAKISTALVSSIFFGPFGAALGMGLGLLASGLRGDFKKVDPLPPRIE